MAHTLQYTAWQNNVSHVPIPTQQQVYLEGNRPKKKLPSLCELTLAVIQIPLYKIFKHQTINAIYITQISLTTNHLHYVRIQKVNLFILKGSDKPPIDKSAHTCMLLEVGDLWQTKWETSCSRINWCGSLVTGITHFILF